MDDDIWRLPGIGGRLQDIYMQTAQVPDIRFAWAAVVCLFSVVGSRKYKTLSGNYTSLCMMILARSSSGKNHILSFVNECLKQSGLSNLIIDPTGCASKQGLFSTLKRCPSQLMVIDESGHARQASKGDAHAVALKGAIMSLVSNNEGDFSLPATSERGLSKKDRDAKHEYERRIEHPALTYIEISTAEKLLNTVSPEDIDSGELGRYLILTDDGKIPNLAEDDPPSINLPDDIRHILYTIRYNPDHRLTEEQAWECASDLVWRDWNETDPLIRGLTRPTEDMIVARLALLKEDPGFMMNSPDDPHRPPVPVLMKWEDANLRKDIFLKRQQELLEQYWTKGNSLHSKQHENAMRLSLCYALMDEECRTNHIISRVCALRVMQVVDHLIEQTDTRIVPEIACSDVQRATQVAVEVIRAGAGKPVSYNAWKSKAAWKNLDSSTKKMSVIDSLTDYSIIAIRNEDQTRASKFNECLYVWVGEGVDVEDEYRKFMEARKSGTP